VNDSGVRLWDAGTSKLLYELSGGHLAHIAIFSPSGRELYVGADDAIEVWNVSDGSFARDLVSDRPPGSRASYFTLTFSPNGALVAAIDTHAATVQVWDANTGQYLHEVSLERAVGSRPSLSFSADGHWLAANNGGEPRVINTRTWAPIAFSGASLGDVNHLSFDPRKPELATVTRSGDVSIWSIPDGARLHHLEEVGAAVDHVAYSPDGEYLGVAARDGVVRVWNATTGARQLTLKNHADSVPWIEFDATSRLVVSAGTDGQVVISDVLRAAPIVALRASQDPVVVAHFDPASRRVVGASWDGATHVWSAASPYLRWSSPAIGRDCGTNFSVEEERRFIAVYCAAHGTYIWDTHSDQLLAALPPDNTSEMEAFPTVSPAGDRAAVSMGNTVTIYALPGGQVVRTVKHNAAVTALAFATSGRDLASGSTDGALRITHDAGDSLSLAPLATAVNAVRFLPDGRLIATSASQLSVYTPAVAQAPQVVQMPISAKALRISADGRRLVALEIGAGTRPPALVDLDPQGPHVVARFEAGRGATFSARFVRGDREILTASGDGIPRRWDAATGKLLTTYRDVSSGLLRDATMDPTGSLMVTAGIDGSLRFVDANSGMVLWVLKVESEDGLSGIHFEDRDVVVRHFRGAVSRWSLHDPPSDEVVHELLRCLPVEFEAAGGGVIERAPCDTLQQRGPS
jgi:WD40 repeat protein